MASLSKNVASVVHICFARTTDEREHVDSAVARHFANTTNERQNVGSVVVRHFVCTTHERETVYNVMARHFANTSNERHNAGSARQLARVFFAKSVHLLVWAIFAFVKESQCVHNAILKYHHEPNTGSGIS